MILARRGGGRGERLGCGRSEPRDEEFPLEDELLGQVRVELHEELLLDDDFAAPFLFVDGLGLLEALDGKARHAGEVEGLRSWEPNPAGFPRRPPGRGSGPPST